jgi:CheY-like chemotaxis protein
MDQTNQSKRVLVVDDNQEAADLTAELLRLHGYDAAVAYAGLPGLDKARTFEPDAVLLDLGMPGMDGYQVAGALRALPDFDHVALIAFTAWGDPVTRQRVRDTGFDGHLVKPASLDNILQALAKGLLERAAMQTQAA